jgi:prepilin-type N-terminal cleavage/methylation domain-containing protein
MTGHVEGFTLSNVEGFTLVEIVLAMAVAAIGLVAVLGLIPQGLQASRDAADNTISATLVHDIFSTIRTTPFTNITNLDSFGFMPSLTHSSYTNLQAFPVNGPLVLSNYLDEAGFYTTPDAHGFYTNGYYKVVLTFQPELPSSATVGRPPCICLHRDGHGRLAGTLGLAHQYQYLCNQGGLLQPMNPRPTTINHRPSAIPHRPSTISERGFTLIEMIASVAILVGMSYLLFAAFNQTSKAWLQGESRVETFTAARAALDLMSRELAQAMVNIQRRTPVLRGELRERPCGPFFGATGALAFLAPVGDKYGSRVDLAEVVYRLSQPNASTVKVR